jgi:hypothetical protein
MERICDQELENMNPKNFLRNVLETDLTHDRLFTADKVLEVASYQSDIVFNTSLVQKRPIGTTIASSSNPLPIISPSLLIMLVNLLRTEAGIFKCPGISLTCSTNTTRSSQK